MVKITASLVKELRRLTGAGIMDCKKVLIKSNGNIDLAIDNMRQFGIIKSIKKSDFITSNGIIISKIKNGLGFILEVNCQTDFVSKNLEFLNFANKILDTAINYNITNIEFLKNTFEKERIELIAKIGENVNINRIGILQGDLIYSYQHGMNIGVLVSIKNSNENLAKKIAMHIAACKPKFIKPENIPIEIIEKEYQIQSKIALKYGKSKKITEKIVENQMKKFIDEISLINQAFIMDPDKNINQLLNNQNAEINSFICFELGETLKY